MEKKCIYVYGANYANVRVCLRRVVGTSVTYLVVKKQNLIKEVGLCRM